MKSANRRVLIGFLIICSALILFLLLAFLFISFSLPNVSKMENLKSSFSSQIFDREGNLLYTVHGDENREKVLYEDVSEYLINATIAVEDENFWNHRGIDLKGILRAMGSNIFGIGKKSGGSTITQQYSKNAFLSSEKTYSRKIKEMVLSLNLEFHYDKKQILELYLNKIPYGNSAFGIKKAAEIYFGANTKHLSVAESAVLAALPQAPSKYNPYGENRYSHLLTQFETESLKNREINSEADLIPGEFVNGLIGKNVPLTEDKEIFISGRANLVIDKMYELGMISLSERRIAYDDLEKLEFKPFKEEILHPHFVFYILSQLEEKYGRDLLESGGFKIYTTLDPNIQNYVENLADQKKSSIKRVAGANNMAVLTANVKTGEILAMLGSLDYFDEKIDGNVNVVMRPRQPGSSFKPFVYARAFLNGFAPSSRIDDTPMKIASKTPQNFDGNFMGNLSMRQALGQSRNIPAIRAYYLAGEQKEIIPFVEKMGISSLNPEFDYGYPLAIGSGEVSLFEMVQAYSVFANNGVKIDLLGILKIEDMDGNILFDYVPDNGKEVIDPAIAFLINNILSDKSVSIGGNLSVSGQITAAKSGTSTKKSKGKGSVRPGDLWTVGYNPSFVTGIWVGNTDGTGLNYSAEAYYTVSPIFSSIMKEVLKNSVKEPFPIPEGIKFIWVNKKSGLLPAKFTPAVDLIKEVFAEKYFIQNKREIYIPSKMKKSGENISPTFLPI